MKRIILLTLTAGLWLNIALAGESKEKEVKVQTSAKCGMCKKRLERTLGLSKGVVASNLDLNDKVMTVTYNANKTDEATIREIIRKTGYDADGQEAVQSAHDKLPKCCRKTAEAH